MGQLGGPYQLFIGGAGGTGTYSTYGFFLDSEPIEQVGAIRTNFKSVPYFDGDYDFTRMDGKAHYDGTDLIYVFRKIVESPNGAANSIETAVRQFTRMLAAIANRTLYDNWSGKTFTNCTCIGTPEVEYSGIGYEATVTVTFHSTVSTADGSANTSYYDYDTETLTAGDWTYIAGNETAVWESD